jgi:small-conductance mechanosensitive channel
MRWLLALLLFSHLAWSAAVDPKLYEGTDKENYYKEIQKEIESAAASGARSTEMTAKELQQLRNVKEAAAQKVQIERYEMMPLSGQKISTERFYTALAATASLRLKQEENSRTLEEMQSKLAFLKQAIENITEKNKKQLLSYQLQFAYYKLQYKNIEEKTALLNTHEEEIKQAMLNALALLQCDLAEMSSKPLIMIDSRLDAIAQEKVGLQIDREKALVEAKGTSEKILKKIENADTRYQKALDDKIVIQTQRAICMLHEEHNKEFFTLLSEIETLTSRINPDKRALYTKQITILREIAKDVFGTTKLLFGITLQGAMEAFSSFIDHVRSPLFVFNENPISLLSLIKMVLLIALGLVAGMFYKRWIIHLSHKWPNMSQTSIRLTTNIGYYLIVFIAIIIAIVSIGIDMTSISLIAGALSIGIGFGLQTVVSNLIAGIMLMFERTIRIGDTIEINDVLRGRVTDMRIRSTTIKTFDNIDIVVPNSSFIQNNVINWTLEDPTRRLRIPFGVAYGTKVEDVKKAVLGELEQSDLKYIKTPQDRHPEVWMVAMNSSSVDYELLVWIEWNNKLKPNSLRSDFLILIYNALYKHNIQIPFPQLDLHVKEVPPKLPE